MARIVDVAALAGVTPSVVSRLLNGDPSLRIRPETRDRILAAARDMEYVPNHAARALRRSRVGALGLALHDIHNPVYTEILAGAEAEARRAGYVLMLASVESLASDDEMFRRVLHGGAIDGLMMQRDSAKSDAAVMAHAASAGVPVVVLNERVGKSLAGVAVDDRSGAFAATSHLIELGHTRIAHLRAAGRNSRSRDRQAGWEDALRVGGLSADPQLVAAGGPTAESGHAGLSELFARGVDFTAVFAGGMLSAVGAVNAAFAHGQPVPEQLSVVGFHDAPLTNYLRPALTVVRMPIRQLGESAVRLLIERLDGKPPRQEMVSSPAPELVRRESSAALVRRAARGAKAAPRSTRRVR